jgi:hypothetical protein
MTSTTSVSTTSTTGVSTTSTTGVSAGNADKTTTGRPRRERPAAERHGGNTVAAQRAYARRGRRTAPDHEPAALPRRRGAATMVAGRLPFVTVIMGLLGCGLATTLLLTTRSAEDSYQLADQRAINQQLSNERARLQREVEPADSAPSLAAAAAKLGMVPARDPAHLVVGPDGTVVVIGKARAAAGMAAPLLNPVLPLVDPNGTMQGRVYPDSTVLSSGAAIGQSGIDARAAGEQLVQVPIGALVVPPAAPAAALPAALAAAGPAPATAAAPAAAAVVAPAALPTAAAGVPDAVAAGGVPGATGRPPAAVTPTGGGR